jgi:hypothetical protein
LENNDSENEQSEVVRSKEKREREMGRGMERRSSGGWWGMPVVTVAFHVC